MTEIQTQFHTIFVRIMREFGKGSEARITLSSPNGTIHHVYRGKLNKEGIHILRDYNIVRLKLWKGRWFIENVVYIPQQIQRQLVSEHAMLIPFTNE